MLLFSVFQVASAQKKSQTIILSDTLFIKGAIKNPKFYTLKDLDTLKSSSIPNQLIYNHNGEIKDSLKDIRGVKLIDLLKPIQFEYQKPRELNEFFFVLTATDGYRVVFSWNEIYNTELGNAYFVITECNGDRIQQMKNRILFISTHDIKPSRRHIKSLKTIEVKRL